MTLQWSQVFIGASSDWLWWKQTPLADTLIFSPFSGSMLWHAFNSKDGGLLMLFHLSLVSRCWVRKRDWLPCRCKSVQLATETRRSFTTSIISSRKTMRLIQKVIDRVFQNKSSGCSLMTNQSDDAAFYCFLFFPMCSCWRTKYILVLVYEFMAGMLCLITIYIRFICFIILETMKINK